MSQVTEQSVRFQTALASIKLIQASAVLDLTEDDFDFLLLLSLLLPSLLIMFIPSTFKRPVSSWKALNLRKTLLMASSVRLKPLNCSRLPCVYAQETLTFLLTQKKTCVNNFNCRGFGPLLEDKLCLIFKLAPSVCRMTFPILASLLVRLVVLLPFQLLRLSLATPSRWTPLALSVFLHCVVALLLTLL